MHWTVANAKQKFSQLLRDAAQEPQRIFSRARLVAVVLHPESFQEFKAWQEHRQRTSIGTVFGELRKLCAQEGYELAVPRREDRPNAFVDTTAKVPV